ncbi:hypothetical protein PR202_ga31011 [Eleusine coracana subsp. coracana]|uniref:Uncharacterized protein n=1 Tax=Eleusine coracana subsp. coracana TaxID=191504 RepID=A0AAV5DQM1_ELECO|nr:hypothetical protein PR202_ga31011 [Eleusine coracana subsp. coracana]
MGDEWGEKRGVAASCVQGALLSRSDLLFLNQIQLELHGGARAAGRAQQRMGVASARATIFQEADLLTCSRADDDVDGGDDGVEQDGSRSRAGGLGA